MPVLRYHRMDLELQISRLPSAVRFRASTPAWSPAPIDIPLGGEAPADVFPAALDPVLEVLAGVQWDTSGLTDGPNHDRCLLRVDDTLAGHPWEAWLAPIPPPFPSESIIRAARSPLRVGELPLTLPIRIVQGDPWFRISDIANDVFWQLGPAWPEAVTVEEVPLWALPDFQTGAGWPTGDILHLAMSQADPTGNLLTRGKPELSGSVGWFERLLSRWQSRLLILEARDDAEADLARRIGSELTDRGGPAVLIADLTDTHSDHSFFVEFYAAVFHDRPLDWSVASSLVTLEQQGIHTPAVTLYGGEGREDALRVGHIARDLAAMAEAIDEQREDADVLMNQVDRQLRYDPEHADDEGPDAPGFPPGLTRSIVEELGRDLGTGVVDRLDTFRFEEHESEGVVPMVEVLGRVRSRPPFDSTTRPHDQANFDEPRFINARLRNTGSEASGNIGQDTPLTVGIGYLLAIDIGPRPDGLHAARSVAVVNEVLLIDPQVDGRWVDVAVTGIDFEVSGNPVQQLWIPERGPSQSVLFAITPSVTGYAALRFCVYVDQNLVQSFRLGAFVRGPSADLPDFVPEEMASLLDLSVDEVEGRLWLSRLEWGADVTSIQSATPRGLSIVSNQLRDDWIITTKGAETFKVRIYQDLSDRVAGVREALELASLREPTMPADRQDWPYDFADDTNQGTEAQLQEKLIALASIGYDLFTELVPKADRAKLRADLGTDTQKIKVAQLLLEKVIPWSVIYDRDFDAAPASGNAAVCRAGIPSAAGDMPAVGCREHPLCLLNPANATLLAASGAESEKSVVCPRHFWGFGHLIELPVRQIRAGGVAEPPQETISAGASARVALGMNGGLVRAGAHRDQIREVAAKAARKVSVVSEAFDKDGVVSGLEDTELDLVYLYCHAEGGRGTPFDPPVLKFRPLPGPPQAQGPETHVKPANLSAGDPYAHGPLVILNGCRTAAFRPDTLSRFISTFVEDRWAAGVLGTEISVFEQLATEIGLEFLQLVLDGESAGVGLLRIRRRLLAKNNPLGLAYTLYADSDLTLA